MGGTIIGLAIIAVVVLIGGGFIWTSVINFIDGTSALAQAIKLNPQPVAGETVCDLRIKVYAEYVGIGSPVIQLGGKTSHPEVRDYTWFDCYQASAFPVADLIDLEKYNQESSFNSLVVNIVEEDLDMKIVLRENGRVIDAKLQPNMFKHVKIPAGIKIDDYAFSEEFIVTNIPHRDYVLEIYFGRAIEGLQSGDPYISTVCMANKSTCNPSR